MARSKGYGPLWHSAKGKKFSSQIDPKVKVAVIFGEHDVLLPEDIAQERSVLPRHAEWIRVKNCAHVIMWNFPKLTVDFIKKSAGLN
jgi:pimeloyl-ACP methyl ester carboxylesterase